MNVMQSRKRIARQQERGYEQGFQVGVNAAVKVNMFAVIQYLGDKRGWKRERIFDALQWLHKHAEMILEELTTFDEVVEAVKEEYGIIEEDGVFYLLSDAEMERQNAENGSTSSSA